MFSQKWRGLSSKGCEKVAFALDVILITSSGLLSNRSNFGGAFFIDSRSIAIFLVVVLSYVLLVTNVRSFSRQLIPSPFHTVTRVTAIWIAICAAVGLSFAVLGHEPQPFLRWIMSWSTIGLVALCLERVIFAAGLRHLARVGAFKRRVVIVGGGDATSDILQALSSSDNQQVEIVGIFDDRSDERSPGFVAGFPKLGTVDDLVTYARNTPVDLIIFTLPMRAERRILNILDKLWVLPVDIRLAAHVNKLRFHRRAYSFIGTVPVLDMFDRPIVDSDFIIKTCFDKIIGTLCLCLLAPIMVLIAIAIKLDSRGPVLFRQKRYGFNNEIIEVFKFRSMKVDTLDFEAAKVVCRGDPRVTRVGRFIRKTSLDELPQLFNVVLKGNLSLVGPRPHAISGKAADRLYDQVVSGYFARHRVVPGMTGWAQVNGWRGETDTSEKIQKRVEFDLYYIENWSMLMDVYILARTPFAVLGAKNAY